MNDCPRQNPAYRSVSTYSCKPRASGVFALWRSYAGFAVSIRHRGKTRTTLPREPLLGASHTGWFHDAVVKKCGRAVLCGRPGERRPLYPLIGEDKRPVARGRVSQANPMQFLANALYAHPMCYMMACHLFGRQRFLSSIVEGSSPDVTDFTFCPIGHAFIE